MTHILFALVVGVLGLAIGSFLNVVIYRVPRGESLVSPPSRCPRCETQILNRHNVPVLGWLVLRGRCHRCALPISARYPLVEAATGLLFAVLALVLGLSLALPVVLFLAAVAIARTMIAVDAAKARTAAFPTPATVPTPAADAAPARVQSTA